MLSPPPPHLERRKGRRKGCCGSGPREAAEVRALAAAAAAAWHWEKPYNGEETSVKNRKGVERGNSRLGGVADVGGQPPWGGCLGCGRLWHRPALPRARERGFVSIPSSPPSGWRPPLWGAGGPRARVLRANGVQRSAGDAESDAHSHEVIFQQ